MVRRPTPAQSDNSENCGSVGGVLLAAGDGQRLGRGPKALVLLAGRPMLSWALEAMLANNQISEVVVVAHNNAMEATRTAVREVVSGDRVQVIEGGMTRQDSALRGLLALPQKLAYVAVSDAARPLTPYGQIDRLLETLLGSLSQDFAGIVPGVPLFDTIREVGPEGNIVRTVDRDVLRSTQTPQLFRRAELQNAYQLAAETYATFTDDASVVENAGGKILMAPGDSGNFKITVERDLRNAKLIMRNPEIRLQVRRRQTINSC